jgi:hypothetical protein
MAMGLDMIVGDANDGLLHGRRVLETATDGEAAPPRGLHARRAELGGTTGEFVEAAIVIPGRVSRPYAAVRRVSLIVTSPALFVCPAPILISM